MWSMTGDTLELVWLSVPGYANYKFRWMDKLGCSPAGRLIKVISQNNKR